MKLKKIHIQNYKSLVDLEIIEPNPFTVFAGPNGSGKSNIFEALEFIAYASILNVEEVESLFGGKQQINNFKSNSLDFLIEYYFEHLTSYVGFLEQDFKGNSSYLQKYVFDYDSFVSSIDDNEIKTRLSSSLKQFEPMKFFFNEHLRLFIKNETVRRINYTSDKKLFPDASNLEAIIKKILSTPGNEEFTDWLDLFVPGFESIEIHSDNISGKDFLLIYEKGTKRPFTKNLISDGTHNILCLLAAVYHAKEPQFLCIEEPENGLNPYVVESLVSFFRQQCEEKGHYIWLNTHSQTLVKELKPHELILVDKIDGATKVKQFSKDLNLYGLEMDTAWLSNALGGGVPW